MLRFDDRLVPQSRTRLPHRLSRTFFCIAAAVAIAAAPRAAVAQGTADTADHVYSFAQTWTCRTIGGAVVRRSGTRNGNTVRVHVDTIGGDAGKPAAYDERYEFDPARGRWHVEIAPKTVSVVTADAAPWTGTTWTVDGRDVNAIPQRVTDELVAGGDLRRVVSSPTQGGWYPESAERCTPGSTPPSETTCIAENFPASTLAAATVNGRFIPANAPQGVVQVVISLDEGSHVTATRVQSSPSAVLNGPALAAARASTFRTEIRNCKPLAADYVFSVNFGP